MEETREPRNKSTYTQSIDLQKRSKEHAMMGIIVSSINGAGKSGPPIEKNETGSLSYTKHKN